MDGLTRREILALIKNFKQFSINNQDAADLEINPERKMIFEKGSQIWKAAARTLEEKLEEKRKKIIMV